LYGIRYNRRVPAATDAPTVWVFEDQLNPHATALFEAPKESPVLLIESRHNFGMFPYHKKRITFLISAMRHFAEELAGAERDVRHYPLKGRGYRDSFPALKHHFAKRTNRELWITEPSEWHTRDWLESVPGRLAEEFDTPDVTIRYFPNRLFLTDRQHFAKWLQGRKRVVMEHYYRQMRKEHGLLMDGDTPAGGEWNYDRLNRKPAPKGHEFPASPQCEPDDLTKKVIRDVNKHFPDHPGSTDGFDMPCDRQRAKQMFDDFVKNRLPLFGDYEDAMVTGEKTLYHSLVSPVINAGLVEPLALCKLVEKAYRKGKVPINAAEGFIRQIIGWREFVYGIYWSLMPEYRRRNPRGDDRPLPDFYWDGKTKMNCLHQSIGHVVEDAFSHHIQRLMVICNFATLAGLSPQAVNDWFLAMYVDSHDWVVTPNVIGMAMNSDEGVIATKPYVSSANYINKMSDYCGPCEYDPKERIGPKACPFNFLYWSFMDDQLDTVGRNPRVARQLTILDNFGEQVKAEMRRLREEFLSELATDGYAAWNHSRGRAAAEGRGE
jgi:deoxyribodipyrimidine photolyase-related protein